jgi:predicted nucleotide-binding protein (sugar kinase/HSP70/actin superfamily)
MDVQKRGKNKLEGRTLWIPRMTYIGARLAAAVFRSAGIDARVTPPSDAKTLEYGGLYTSGEECYPEKVTIGDFLRIIHSEGFSPERTAFFMPTAEGPCRFGQYAPYLRQVLDGMGYQDIPIISPTSKNSYDGIAAHSLDVMRTMWRGLVASDIVRKLLLKTRPYETTTGDADDAFERGVEMLEKVLEKPRVSPSDRIAGIEQALIRIRDEFRAIPARYTKDRPLIGVVGEIFCRLNTFSNGEAVRSIEAHGGEVWLSDVTEWVWYTNWSQKRIVREEKGTFSLAMLGAMVKNSIQKRDEHRLLAHFAEDFAGYEEPHDIGKEVLQPGWPYLPADGALGEMALSIGKSCYLYGKGADGIIDISPFSCMNGIVSEAVYHSLSRDHDDLPVRNFYFDASSSNMDRDLDIFMELAQSYMKRKKALRRYPACFGNGQARAS